MTLPASIRSLLPFSSNRWFVKIIYGLVASLGMFIVSWERGDKFVDNFVSKFHGKKENFDFIVVGAGSAGSVVANRLSENPQWKVLLIEAGGEPAPFHSVPAFAIYLNNYKSTDWRHLSVQQKNVGEFCPDNSFSLSQGKSLGGTSNIHHMIFLRGNPQDFNHWANVTGEPGWGYDNLIHHFKKSEDYHGEWRNYDVHGQGGPLRVQVPDYHPLSSYFLNASQELGYNQVDLNGYYAEGVDNVHYATKRGVRHDVYKAFLKPARRRKNLTIFKYAQVNKILINDKKQAYGVEYDRHGSTRRAFASKEVIVSCGALQTPKLLMLSGIGPADHLEQLGITVHADLPVGKNLQDHVGTFLGPFLIDEPSSLILDRDVTPSSFLKYLTHGRGVVTTVLTQAIGIFGSSFVSKAKEQVWPDLLTLFAPFGIHSTAAKDLSRSFGLREDKLGPYLEPYIGRDAFWMIVSVGRPSSRGYVRLASADPYESLVINPNYYAHPQDMLQMLEGVKLNLKIGEETGAFKSLGAHFNSNPLPGCEDVPPRTDAYWECYSRNFAFSLGHSSGTAAMGTGKTSVVDPQLRVVGIHNLRVIDASVMPTIPVSNIHAPVIMIGEKGADIIKEYWTGQSSTSEAYGPAEPAVTYGPPLDPIPISINTFSHRAAAQVASPILESLSSTETQTLRNQTLGNGTQALVLPDLNKTKKKSLIPDLNTSSTKYETNIYYILCKTPSSYLRHLISDSCV